MLVARRFLQVTRLRLTEGGGSESADQSVANTGAGDGAGSSWGTEGGDGSGQIRVWSGVGSRVVRDDGSRVGSEIVRDGSEDRLGVGQWMGQDHEWNTRWSGSV